MYYKGDTGLFVRYLSNEYTGQHRDVPAILRRIKPHIDRMDFEAIERMLTDTAIYVDSVHRANTFRKVSTSGKERNA